MRCPLRSAIAGLALGLGVVGTASAFPATVQFHQFEGHLSVGFNLHDTTHVPGHDSWTIDGLFVEAPARVFPVPTGARTAGLFEPGRADVLSAWVLVSIDPPVLDDIGTGRSQHVHIDFSSRDTSVASLPAGIPFGGGPFEDGTLQDLSPFLDLPAAGLTVLVESAGEAPEPAVAMFLTIGVAALSVWRIVAARAHPQVASVPPMQTTS